MPSAREPRASTKPYTHYDILRLTRHDIGELSRDDIKTAYRRALLLHHPDKVSSVNNGGALKRIAGQAQTPQYSIDDIVTAHEVLSDPLKRDEYDRFLEQGCNNSWQHTTGHKGTHIGVESYDLEDLTYDEVNNTWSKSCRCGDERGYTLTEAELEKESQHGEIYAGCRGCSLFIKVQFSVDET